MTIPTVIGLFIAFVGSGGVVFAALRWNRDEAQGYISIMKDLNEELQESYERAKRERDDLRVQVEKLSDECRQLREEVGRLREAVNGL